MTVILMYIYFYYVMGCDAMKIEKISDTQVKFTLTHSDLSERNIKMTELAYGSEKTQELFREMMEQAMLECNFYAENNTPLMIEAIPVSSESVMIIVTKVPAGEDFDKRFNLTAEVLEEKKFMKAPLFNHHNGKKQDKPGDSPVKESPYLIYSFDSLDEAGEAASLISSIYSGESSLYKEKRKFFIVLGKKPDSPEINARVESIMTEFSKKQEPSYLPFLQEYGEIIIKSEAVMTLTGIH